MSLIDVLIVDDEEDIRNIIAAILKDEGFNPKVAANSTQALKILAEKPVSAVILDIWLQGSEMDGLGILEVIKKRYPLMPVIIISVQVCFLDFRSEKTLYLLTFRSK